MTESRGNPDPTAPDPPASPDPSPVDPSPVDRGQPTPDADVTVVLGGEASQDLTVTVPDQECADLKPPTPVAPEPPTPVAPEPPTPVAPEPPTPVAPEAGEGDPDAPRQPEAGPESTHGAEGAAGWVPPPSAGQAGPGWAGPGVPPPGDPGELGAFAARYGLIRPLAGRAFAGVCVGIGRATGTDPVLWRVLFGVLTLAGGVGLLAYFLGWILMPSEDDTASPVEAMLGRGESGTSAATVLVIGAIVLATVAVGAADLSHMALLGAAAIVGVAYLLTKRGRPGPGGETAPASSIPRYQPTQAPSASGPFPAGPGTVPPAPFGYGPAGPLGPSATSGAGATRLMPPVSPLAEPAFPSPGGFKPHPPLAPHGPFAGSFGAQTPHPLLAPTPPYLPPISPRIAERAERAQQRRARRARERSPLGRLTFSGMLIAVGVLASVDLSGVDVVGSAYVAVALAVLAGGLLAGSWFGRARWLIPLGMALCMVLGTVSAAHKVDHVYRGSVTWAPTSVDMLEPEYSAEAGNAVLDLSGVDFQGKDVAVALSHRWGDARVILPASVDADVSVTLEAGVARVFGETWGGIGSFSRQIRDVGSDGEGGGHLALTVTAEKGSVVVSR